MTPTSVIDFSNVPFIDHHCHPYEIEKTELSPLALAKEFFHGMGDLPDPAVEKARHWPTTAALDFHLVRTGVVQTLVCQLAGLFDCPPELEAVANERNRRTRKGFAAYVKFLYEDAAIAATVLDSGLPENDPVLDLIPGRKLRLFKLEPLFEDLMETSNSYRRLQQDYLAGLERAVRQKGFVGVKAHPAEEVGFGIEPVWADEAEAAFAAARKGDPDARRKQYVAIFTATLLACRELDVPVHVHSGFTGGLWKGPIHHADPFLLAPFLRQDRFLQTKLVLLHAGYPWTKQAGQLAHTFPHLWVDMGQITPWASMRIVECYRDIMAWAPLSKVVVGSGGHGSPEIAWLAARTARIALGEVLGEGARLGLIARKAAEQAGRMILHDNAARLYGLEDGAD